MIASHTSRAKVRITTRGMWLDKGRFLDAFHEVRGGPGGWARFGPGIEGPDRPGDVARGVDQRGDVIAAQDAVAEMEREHQRAVAAVRENARLEAEAIVADAKRRANALLLESGTEREGAE